MISGRNRSLGWKHAKLTGHKNEDLVKCLIDNDAEYAKALVERIGKNNRICNTSIGGLHELNVSGINGRKTKSKTDLKLFLENEETVNISIKKSLSGQVYFVRAGLFFETYEKQFGETIPPTVKRAIELFWATADDAVQIVEEYADKSKKRSYDLQLRHKSVNATTLKNFDKSLYEDMLSWFTENSFFITKLCFAMGAARDKNEWSEYVWYINLLKENNIDEIFEIYDICAAAHNHAEAKTYYGTVNGGTTIQLPFGFVEWHQEQLQFHHDYHKIKRLINHKGY